MGAVTPSHSQASLRDTSQSEASKYRKFDISADKVSAIPNGGSQ